MSVKRMLAKRDAGFISLHEVLTRMTKVDGATYQDAAKALFRAMLDEEEAPSIKWKWRVISNLLGKEIASGKEEARAVELLVGVADFGMPNKLDDLKDGIPF
jgi:hypothetical protein